MKVCTSCAVEKTEQEFSPDSRYKSGLRSQCDLCRRTAQERTTRNRWLRRIYGITVEEYERLESEQNGLCAVCGCKETRSTRSSKRVWEYNLTPRLVVDHDHVTGKIRGLLCHKCNVGIGQLNDDPKLLRAALTYLEEH